ncbi:WD40 domain-containing protein [Histoplasma ohiense]|nr:WD40 domain-containing protein [Histoplasma ohiense (nom. inval.)]
MHTAALLLPSFRLSDVLHGSRSRYTHHMGKKSSTTSCPCGSYSIGLSGVPVASRDKDIRQYVEPYRVEAIGLCLREPDLR